MLLNQEFPCLFIWLITDMSCFQGLLLCPEAASLIFHNFCIYHIDAPGHEVIEKCKEWQKIKTKWKKLTLLLGRKMEILFSHYSNKFCWCSSSSQYIVGGSCYTFMWTYPIHRRPSWSSGWSIEPLWVSCFVLYFIFPCHCFIKNWCSDSMAMLPQEKLFV